jgi:hypothetical protein
MIIKFSTKRNLFPIRERAPKLAIIQAISFCMITVIPYITEIVVALGVSWQADATSEIQFSRKFLKALYMTMRVLCYFVFLFRVLVIYTSWKLRNEDAGMTRLFKNEDSSIVVRFWLNGFRFCLFWAW